MDAKDAHINRTLLAATAQRTALPVPVKPHLTAREVAAGLVLLARGWSSARVLASLLAQRALLIALRRCR